MYFYRLVATSASVCTSLMELVLLLTFGLISLWLSPCNPSWTRKLIWGQPARFVDAGKNAVDASFSSYCQLIVCSLKVNVINCFYPFSANHRGLEPMLAVIGQEGEYTLDRLPICCRTKIYDIYDNHSYSYLWSAFESLINVTQCTSLACWGKLEFPERTDWLMLLESKGKNTWAVQYWTRNANWWVTFLTSLHCHFSDV